MSAKTKAGQFSPVSIQAARIIPSRPVTNPRLLMAYLALARQTSMFDEGGHGKNMVTGAGAQKISQVVGCNWSKAKTLEQALVGTGLIIKASTGLRAGHLAQARWVLVHKGDVDLPHALIDGLDGVTGIRRISSRPFDG